MAKDIIIERGCAYCSLCDEDSECYCNQLKKLKQENATAERSVFNLKQENKRLNDFLKWLLKQQYYILHKNLKAKIKEVINDK